jgi:hypothetical protein
MWTVTQRRGLFTVLLRVWNTGPRPLVCSVQYHRLIASAFAVTFRPRNLRKREMAQKDTLRLVIAPPYDIRTPADALNDERFLQHRRELISDLE